LMTVSAIVSEPVTPPRSWNPQLPELLQQLILAMLDKHASRRSDAEAAAAALADMRFSARDDKNPIAPVRSRRLKKAIDSLAVLPFMNVGGDPETEYLGDGLTDTLINRMAQLRRLRVVPRSLVFRYKGLDVDPQAIGRELNVRALLTGRVAHRGENLL